MRRFRDRGEAGKKLATELASIAADRPIVLALPRGGVPVAYEIAHALGAPLDIWVVRKIGVPWHPELGLGAVAEGGRVHYSRAIQEHLGISDDELAELTEAKRHEVEVRVRKLRGDRPPPVVRGRTVILVDDGVATGGTVRAAIQSIRELGPAQIVLAVPVASPDVLEKLAAEVERVSCLATPTALYAIGVWYDDFSQVDDGEVLRLLDLARREQAARAPVPPTADPGTSAPPSRRGDDG